MHCKTTEKFSEFRKNKALHNDKYGNPYQTRGLISLFFFCKERYLSNHVKFVFLTVKTAESILICVIPSLLNHAEKHTRLMNKKKRNQLVLKALNKLNTKSK